MLDEEDKEVTIERLHSNPLSNCETPFWSIHLSTHLSIHPSSCKSVMHRRTHFVPRPTHLQLFGNPGLLVSLHFLSTLFIFYKNVVFWPKPSKEIEIATNKITTMFLILEQFQALMFL